MGSRYLGAKEGSISLFISLLPAAMVCGYCYCSILLCVADTVGPLLQIHPCFLPCSQNHELYRYLPIREGAVYYHLGSMHLRLSPLSLLIRGGTGVQPSCCQCERPIAGRLLGEVSNSFNKYTRKRQFLFLY